MRKKRTIKKMLSKFKFNKKNAKEDLRKVAVSTFIIGIIGFILPADKVPKYHGLLISAASFATWIMALVSYRPKKKK